MPADMGSIGASVDLRRHTGTRTELIGLFSATRFFPHPQGDTHVYTSDGPELDDPYVLSGYAGFGLRCGKNGHGLHIGLLVGGLRYQGVDMDDRTRHLVSPAACLTLGHHIGAHLDVSADASVMRDVKGYYFFYPLFRLSYVLRRT